MPKDIKFINQGVADDRLEFNLDGFAVNPDTKDAWFGGDFRDIVMTLVGTGTVIVYGSAQRLPPNFAAASTISNSYAPIALVDYSLEGSTAFIPGATGGTVANETKLFELDTNLLTWIAVKRSVNTVDVLLTETNAQ